MLYFVKMKFILSQYGICLISTTFFVCNSCGRSQNTVPIASTQVAIKGSYSTVRSQSGSSEVSQSGSGHSREHTLSVVGPDAHVE